MITYERKLTTGESTVLQNELLEISRQVKKNLLVILIWPVIWLFIPLLFQASLITCTGSFIIGLLMSLSIYSRFSRKRRKLEMLLKKGTVNALNLTASEYIWLPDFEGEGDHYLFQLDNKQVLLIGGEQYEHIKGFPHEDNEIVTAFNSKQELIYFNIIGSGKALEPIAEIEELDKWDLMNNPAFKDQGGYYLAAGRLADFLPK